MEKRYLFLTGIIIMLITNCTKPYAPKAITNVANYLVVEGVINTGNNDSTIIKLSRTVPLSAGVGTTPETNAIVTIQSDNNQSYTLHELSNGMYVSDNLTLDNTRKYRLSINTSDGNNYLSDYGASINTPPIDSVGFTIKSSGLQVYLNTHSPQNNTHYYRWDFVETWSFTSQYFSSFVSNGTDMVQRTPAQYVYQCWGNNISNDILLSSTANLTQDVVYQYPITFVDSASERLETRYSILLKQYALNADGYSYFQQLRKNTEELGGIFDPQPSELTGNIHCTTNANIPAIGYITVGTIQQKRIFIDRSQVPATWVAKYPYDCTTLDTAYYSNPKTGFDDVVILLVPAKTYLAIIPLFSPPPSNPIVPIGFVYSATGCVDCSIRGTTVEPSFWK